MQFFRLARPNYDSDCHESRENPVRVRSHRQYLPLIACDECGGRGTAFSLRMPLPSDPQLTAMLDGRKIPRDEWNRVVPQLADRLGIDRGRIQPGLKIGPPRGELRGPVLHDVVHPFPGLVWVKGRVIDALQEIKPVGVDFNRVELVSTTGLPVSDESPALWEMTVTGRAWRVGRDEESSVDCPVCGHTGFPASGDLRLDISRWDGSDFFNPDMNPHICIVTERVRELFADRGFSNCRFDLMPWED